MNIVIPAIFGLESTIKEELIRLDFDPKFISLNDGQVTIEVLDSDIPSAVARCNIWLRTAERVLLQIGEGTAVSFDSLFDLTSTISWEEFIPTGWAFHINGYSRKSELFGISACQGIIKKSIVNRLSAKRKIITGSILPENEQLGLVKISFGIVKNVVSYYIDMTGDGLHKRGYRPLAHQAPIKETLAAGLILLSRWRPFRNEALLDPMCGSGTIPIEAAMIAMNIAPGINRAFSSEQLPIISRKVYDEERGRALSLQRHPSEEPCPIFGGDIDKRNVELSTKNAKTAGVSSLISFREMDVLNLDISAIKQMTQLPSALIIANPPYGDRMMEKQNALDLFKAMGQRFLLEGKVQKDLRLSIIAPCDVFEESFGAIADKRRKLYNGMIPCNMYHYFKSR